MVVRWFCFGLLHMPPFCVSALICVCVLWMLWLRCDSFLSPSLIFIICFSQRKDLPRFYVVAIDCLTADIYGLVVSPMLQ